MELERSGVRGHMRILGTIFPENGYERSITFRGTRLPRRPDPNFVTSKLRARELSKLDRIVQRPKAALSPRLFCAWSHGGTPPSASRRTRDA
jgi:hypothetical protein